MATKLVINAISKFLSRFIQNFSKENLEVKLSKGYLELKDIVFDCDVLDDYLKSVLPWLDLKSFSCTSVSIKTPGWTKLKKEPIVVRLGTIQIELEEAFGRAPREHTAPPNPKTSYSFADKVLDGMRVEIEGIHVRLTLAGVPKPAKAYDIDVSNQQFDAPQVLEFMFFNAQFFQTDSEHHPISLKDAKTLNSQLNHVEVYKSFVCSSVSARLTPNFRSGGKQPQYQMKPVVVLDDHHVEFHILIKYSTKGVMECLAFDLDFGDVSAGLDVNQWESLHTWIRSLKYAIDAVKTPKYNKTPGLPVPVPDQNLFSEPLCRSPSLRGKNYTSFGVRLSSITLNVLRGDSEQSPDADSIGLCKIIINDIAVGVLYPVGSLWEESDVIHGEFIDVKSSFESMLSVCIHDLLVFVNVEKETESGKGLQSACIFSSHPEDGQLGKLGEHKLQKRGIFKGMSLLLPFYGYVYDTRNFITFKTISHWPRPPWPRLGYSRDLLINEFHVLGDPVLWRDVATKLFDKELRSQWIHLQKLIEESPPAHMLTRFELNHLTLSFPSEKLAGAEIKAVVDLIQYCSGPNLQETQYKRGLVSLLSSDMVNRLAEAQVPLTYNPMEPDLAILTYPPWEAYLSGMEVFYVMNDGHEEKRDEQGENSLFLENGRISSVYTPNKGDDVKDQQLPESQMALYFPKLSINMSLTNMTAMRETCTTAATRVMNYVKTINYKPTLQKLQKKVKTKVNEKLESVAGVLDDPTKAAQSKNGTDIPDLTPAGEVFHPLSDLLSPIEVSSSALVGISADLSECAPSSNSLKVPQADDDTASQTSSKSDLSHVWTYIMSIGIDVARFDIRNEHYQRIIFGTTNNARLIIERGLQRYDARFSSRIMALETPQKLEWENPTFKMIKTTSNDGGRVWFEASNGKSESIFSTAGLARLLLLLDDHVPVPPKAIISPYHAPNMSPSHTPMTASLGRHPNQVSSTRSSPCPSPRTDSSGSTRKNRFSRTRSSSQGKKISKSLSQKFNRLKRNSRRDAAGPNGTPRVDEHEISYPETKRQGGQPGASTTSHLQRPEPGVDGVSVISQTLGEAGSEPSVDSKDNSLREHLKRAKSGRDVCCGEYVTSLAYKQHQSLIKQLIAENRALRLANGKAESWLKMKEEEHDRTVGEMSSEKEGLLERYQENNTRLHDEIEKMTSELHNCKKHIQELEVTGESGAS